MICESSNVNNSTFGDYSYTGVRCRVSNATIGKFCSIGPCVIICPGKHPIDFVSTHPIFYSLSFSCNNRFASTQAFEEQGSIEIGHDVWIGANSILLEGITVGTGSVIAANSVVNRNVEPYSIVGGSPAKHIRYRFVEEQVQTLLKSNWWNWSDEDLISRVAHFRNVQRFSDLLIRAK